MITKQMSDVVDFRNSRYQEPQDLDRDYIMNASDEEIIFWTMEAFGKNVESEELDRYCQGNLNLDIAKKWWHAHFLANEFLSIRSKFSNKLYCVRKEIDKLRNVRGLFPAPADFLNSPNYQRLKQLEERYSFFSRRYNVLFGNAIDEAFALSKQVFSEVERPRKKNPPKDWKKTKSFWEERCYDLEKKIKLQEERCEKLRLTYERRSGSGGDLARYFPLGRVGGSGNPRNIARLNRKKERQADSMLKALQEWQTSLKLLNSYRGSLRHAEKRYEFALNKISDRD